MSVTKTDGNRVNGVAVREDGDRYVVDVYRGFSVPVPKDGAVVSRLGDPL